MLKSYIAKSLSQAGLSTNQDVALRTFAGASAGLLLAALYAIVFAPGALIHVGIAAAIAAACMAAPMAHSLIMQRRQTNERISKLNLTDPLTKCMNRGAFLRRFDDLMLSPGEAAGRPVGALLLINADGMKSINDNHGVDTGDEVLSVLASAIRTSVRSTDFVGRLGGCEFGVFLFGANTKDAITVAGRIRRNVAQLRLCDHIELSISVGGAVFADDVDSDDVLRIATESLDFARSGGGNRIEMVYLPKAGYPVLVTGSVH